MEQRRKCFNVLGQEVDCILTENWLNAAGVYIEQNDNGPSGAYVDLGNTGLSGFLGEIVLPPAPTDRMKFIDDPVWKHWLKVALMVILAVLVLLTAVKGIKAVV